ncbi:carboxymuconolactone decarboxylase family protein [Methylocystis iwaonis]|uniref:carboxymuconolactone decarboxylase family protein n=1 Tax=Methylocystis iwaonis TaxID=2885079 RepID=UPI002E7C05A6|nr:carboxymuconolactone decarboxylase family protein [Methylocystis iwaonis]
MNALAKLTLPLLTEESVDDPAARTAMESTRKSLGFVPNLYANMANSPGVLDTYLTGYKHFRTSSGFTPVEQEVVFLTISRQNGCAYCMAAHSLVGERMSGLSAPVLEALRDGKPLEDARLQALFSFTCALLSRRGRPLKDELQTFLVAGFSERHVLEILLAISVKTISNYTNHLFDTEVDEAFGPYNWQPMIAA